MERHVQPAIVGFEIVTGTKTVTNKWSFRSAVDLKGEKEGKIGRKKF
jgi:hypothetical protein